MTNPLSDLTKVRANLDRIAAKCGLKIDHYLILPGEKPEGPHRCMVIMHTGGPKVDDMTLRFNEMVKAEEEAERARTRKETFKATKTDLAQIEEDLKGDGLL